jgi:hypothetical protein
MRTKQHQKFIRAAVGGLSLTAGALSLGLALTHAPAARAQEAAPARPSGVIVQDGRGGIGVFSGGATGFIGGTGPNGNMEGIVVGPNGQVRRVRPKPGEPVAVPGSGVTFFDPEGFDPFAFAFGPSRSPFGAGGMTSPAAPQPPAAFDINPVRQAFRKGDYRAAIEAPRAFPFDPDAQQARSLALFALGRYDEAGRALRQALGADAAAGWDWSTVGRFYRRPDDYVRQYQALRRAAVRPVTAEVHLLLAYHAMILQRPDAARPALEAALRLRPGDPIASGLSEALPPE